MTRELYRVDGNGHVLLRVVAEKHDWLPHPVLNRAWLRSMIAVATRRWLRRRSA